MTIKTVALATFQFALFVEITLTNAAQVPDNMVWIPPGTFLMGSPETEKERYVIEGPQTTVTLTRGFYMSKYETTQGEYMAIMGNNPSNFNGIHNTVDYGSESRRPVENVTWYQAMEYCKKLTSREETLGRLPNGYAYRLPTMAEWEYACRAGTVTVFPFGDNLHFDMANFYGKEEYIGGVGTVRNPNVITLVRTVIVGSYKPNPFGLYDMQGNVYEYCLDYWGYQGVFRPGYPGGRLTDPGGLQETNILCELRGGCFGSAGLTCRPAYRVSREKKHSNWTDGFRVVLAWEPEMFLNWTSNMFIQIPPLSQPTYAEPPKKEATQDSLVVVTHGWQPAWKPVDIAWVDTMTNLISAYLLKRGLSNWKVHAHKWEKKARPDIKFGPYGAQIALNNAKEEGSILGTEIANENYTEIHLIGHSAGSGLIQAASEKIKASRSDVSIHLTFLDPFVGLFYEERDNYGKGADWAESYFSHDLETSGNMFAFTEGALGHSYNVDVTGLDANRQSVQVSTSGSGGEVSQTCYQTKSSHGWAYQFYMNTIPPNTVLGSEGFGFPLSKIGGNWNLATNQYGVGKDKLRELGSKGLLSCTPNPSNTSLNIELPRDFSKLPSASVIINSPEHVILHGIDFTLKTASPAWLVANVPITNKVNFVSLEALFTSANGAEGLLSVYAGTNTLGSVDERASLPGMHKHTFPLSETFTNGTQTIGFRLDAFTTTQSTVTVTNVTFGFAQAFERIREPFSLSFAGTFTNGLPLLQLTGPSGFNYIVETSTNLVSWTTAVFLANTNGIVRFVDPESGQGTARFYRAAMR